MARLIRTEKEVEGRYEEVWLVVEEDALEQWPSGPRSIVGQPALRKRRSRARPRRGRLHRRPEAAGDAARSRPPLALRTCTSRADRPHARPGVGRCARRDRPRRPRAADRRVRLPRCGGRSSLRRHRTRRRAQRSQRSTSSGRSCRSCSTPTRRSHAASSSASRACARAATTSRASRRPTSSSRAPTARRSCCTTRWRRTSRSCSGSATRSRCTSRRSTSGAIRDEVAQALGLPPDKVRVVCNYMGGGFGSKNSPDDYTFIAIELARRTAPAGALRADQARGEPRQR